MSINYEDKQINVFWDFDYLKHRGKAMVMANEQEFPLLFFWNILITFLHYTWYNPFNFTKPQVTSLHTSSKIQKVTNLSSFPKNSSTWAFISIFQAFPTIKLDLWEKNQCSLNFLNLPESPILHLQRQAGISWFEHQRCFLTFPFLKLNSALIWVGSDIAHVLCTQ